MTTAATAPRSIHIIPGETGAWSTGSLCSILAQHPDALDDTGPYLPLYHEVVCTVCSRAITRSDSYYSSVSIHRIHTACASALMTHAAHCEWLTTRAHRRA